MAVDSGWLTVGSPSCVCNPSVGVENLGQVRLGLGNELLQLDDLADFFEGEHFVLLVAVDSKTRRIIATVFQARESVDECVEDVFAVFLDLCITSAQHFLPHCYREEVPDS